MNGSNSTTVIDDFKSSVSNLSLRVTMMGKKGFVPFILGVFGMVFIYTIMFHSNSDTQPMNIAGKLNTKLESTDSVVKFQQGMLSSTIYPEIISDTPNIDTDVNERLIDVQNRIKSVSSLLEKDKKTLGIDEEMVRLALKHITSTEKLTKKFEEVLVTNRTFSISVVGGSISVGAGVGGTPGIFATTLGKYLQKMLGSKVTVENGAIGATNSYYYSYCFQTHCNVKSKDLLLWEFAHNDFGYEIAYLGQERLTRMILTDLPNEPQLIYANFLHGRQIHRYSCANSERIGSAPLSEYYDVPSISMPDAVCKLVKAYKADDLLSEHDGNHPGPKAHDMMAIFLAELVKQVLFDTTVRLKKQLEKSNHPLDALVEEENQALTWTSGSLPQKALKPVLFNTTAITRPQCWSQMLSEYRPEEGVLIPLEKYSWRTFTLKKREDRTDVKRLWRTMKEKSFIEFEVDIEPYQDLNSIIAITTITCERNKCGYADVFLDDDYQTTIDCLSRYLITVVHEVAFNVPPGKHVLRVESLDNEGFNIASVSSAYEIPDELLED
ncbi:uncharacterized protein LOC144358880 [Saccoglossus kowalevskii]